MPRTHRLPPPDADPLEDKEAPSILAELLCLFQENSPLRISFEDLSGVLEDVDEFRLPSSLRVHTCDFCLFAKSRRTTHADCIKNKLAANRVAALRMKGYSGECHLGIFELVEPLVYSGRVVGVFYFGSVLIRGAEAKARQRIAKYCSRRGLSQAPFLEKLEETPRIDPASVGMLQARLRLLAKICARLLDSYGLPADRYTTKLDAYFASQQRLHPLAKKTIQYVHRNFANDIQLADVAGYARCHPDHLCRVLRRQFGCGLGEYVHRVRIDHARRLISSRRFSLGEIAFQVGFNDQSYFIKIFKSLVGCTPGEYAAGGEDAAYPFARGKDRPSLSGYME